jgi:hypothetical protein
MATRKNKKTMDMPGTIGGAKIVFPNEPKVTVGTHLTVTTFPDGKTMLQWDHDQLLKEVQAAIAGVNKKPAKKTKR